MAKDLKDLRRRAVEQAKHGNYWAQQCLYVLDLFAAAQDKHQDEIDRLSSMLEFERYG